VAIWYIFPVLVYLTTKNLATLVHPPFDSLFFEPWMVCPNAFGLNWCLQPL
jgi:hypothetical protein